MRVANDWVRADHHVLETQLAVLRAVLTLKGVGVTDRRIAVLWFLRNLDLALEQHLRKEEDSLLPRIQEIFPDRERETLALMEKDHRELRAGLERVGRLLQKAGPSVWEEIAQAGRDLTALLEEHMSRDRLLVGALEPRESEERPLTAA